MAVTTVVLVTLFVALFAPGTANRKTEVADPENVAKAELVKKSDNSPFGTTISKLSIGQVTNYNYAGEPSLKKKEASGNQALDLKKKEEETLLGTIGKASRNKSARHFLKEIDEVLKLVGQVELEKRGKRTHSEKDNKNKSKDPFLNVVGEIVQSVAQSELETWGQQLLFGKLGKQTTAQRLMEVAEDVLKSIGQDKLEKWGNDMDGEKNRAKKSKKEKHEEKETLLETIGEATGDELAHQTLKTISDAFKLVGQVELEKRRKQVKKSKEEKSPIKLEAEELETRGRKNKDKKGGRRRKFRLIQPVPEEEPDTLLDAAADVIGGAADGVADFANGVFNLFGEE